MKLHESIGHGASKNKSMGMRDAHSISLIVLSVMKKFVDQVCPHFPIIGDVNPSVFTFHVPSKKPASDLPVLRCFSHCFTHVLTGFIYIRVRECFC